MTDTPASSAPRRRRNRPKARAHGEGSVYLEQASGLWVAAVDLGIVNGRRKRKRLRFPSQHEARVALTKLRKNLDDGLGAGDDRITVGAFLHRWLAECVEGPLSALREGTRASYANHVRRHLAPGLGHHPLAKLSPMHVQAFLAAKLTERDAAGAPALSPRTVQYLHATLKVALKQSERWGLVARNVARLVEPVRVEKREARILSTEEAGRFLNAVEGDRLRALFYVAVSMGLRRSELCGLRWEHLDLERGVLRVREQLRRVAGRGLVVQGLKTDKSRRTLKVPASVLEELRAHARRQKADRLAAGPLWRDTGYVFTTTTGTPLDGHNLWRSWKHRLRLAGLPDMPFHATRHTAGSFLLSQGADLRTVMGVLGHSQIALTANTYTHLLEEMHADAADRADAALRAVKGRAGG